ncbi:MAG: sulfotransferase [Pseudomonadota bacterium]
MTSRDTTHADHAAPYRPWPIKLFNRLGGPGGPRGFHPENILDAAKAKTRLTELSEAPLMEPLEHLCRALNTEARLSPFGRIVQRERIMGLLVNRLRLDDIMQRHPEIQDQPEPNVLLIAGLARTGTTLLQRALAADPHARALPSWEALCPAPVPGEDMAESHKREKSAQQTTKLMNWLAPDFQTVHPVAYDAPEEDILLLDLTMMSQTAEAVTYVPSYSAWLERQDHRPVYAYFRDVLKTLMWMRPGKPKRTHWVLKSPHHAEYLDIALQTFPNATVIQTHRDPMQTVASCSSLMVHAHSLSCDDPDRAAIARHWLRKSKRMAENAAAARAAHPDRNVVDIQYKDLMKDAAGSIQRIYAAHGDPLTQNGAGAAIAAATAPRPPSTKQHKYALADFALRAEDVRAAFPKPSDAIDTTSEAKS